MKQAIIAYMLVVATIFAACNGSSTESNKNTTPAASSDTSKTISAEKYTCSMHPQVISDTSGHCPKCGMEMVPIKNSSLKKMNIDTMKH